MTLIQWLLLLSVVVFCIDSCNARPDKVVCYLGSWSVTRSGEGQFSIEDIPPKICTHIIYSFVSVTTDADIKILNPLTDLTTEGGLGGFQKVNNLKKGNPNLKTLVAMGGWSEGSTLFSEVFSTSAARKTFALNAATFLKNNDFNGLDIDWEYPAQRGGSPADKDNFIELLKDLRNEFDKNDFLLTAAVPPTENSFLLSYDVPNLAKYLHFINLMAYDFHGSSEPQTGHNSPLFISNAERNTLNAALNADAAVQAWMKNGAPASKLVLGAGLYGHSFTLGDPQCTTARCPSTGPGAPGPISADPGSMGYFEQCPISSEMMRLCFRATRPNPTLSTPFLLPSLPYPSHAIRVTPLCMSLSLKVHQVGVTWILDIAGNTIRVLLICKIEPSSRVFFDIEAMVPYLVNQNSWVSYDNQQSAQLKVNYIMRMNLAGVMVWSIDNDDFKGACGRGRFPVLTTLSTGIQGVTW